MPNRTMTDDLRDSAATSAALTAIGLVAISGKRLDSFVTEDLKRAKKKLQDGIITIDKKLDRL